MKQSNFLFIASFLLSLGLEAQTGIKFYFNNEEIPKVLESYSRASGKKMIIDSGIRGKISIFNPDTVSLDEAFNQISQALAMNSYAIIAEGETYLVRSVKNIQRSRLEVGEELPPPKPERLFSWVVTLKHIPVSVLSKELRNLPSKDGEVSTLKENNQLIVTDWLSNLYRIREIIKLVDVPKNLEAEKMIDEYLDAQKKKKK